MTIDLIGVERRMSMTIDLNRMKTRLEAKREELRANIAGLTEANPVPTDPIVAGVGTEDFEEVAVDFLETNQEQSILANEQALLSEVLRALKRIDDGTYGKCENCGKPVPEKRLEAIPWAARDIKCEEELEQKYLKREELYEQQSF